MEEQKRHYFEYILLRFYDWFSEFRPMNENDFGEVKLQKLLFFLCTVEDRIFQRFQKFYALPKGPVESEILTGMQQDEFTYFKVNGWKNTSLKSDNALDEARTLLTQEERATIDNAIDRLRHLNNHLVVEDMYKLAEISHKWQCWKSAYKLAKADNKKARRMPPLTISMDRTYIYG